MAFDNFEEQLGIEVKDRIYTSLVKRCKLCSGTGLDTNDNFCNCQKEYNKFVPYLFANIPWKYIKLPLANLDNEFKKGCIKQFKRLGTPMNMISCGKNVLIHGKGYGIGKTTLACLILRWFIDHDIKDCWFINMNDFNQEIFKFENDRSDNQMKKYLQAKVLVLDGLGEQFKKEGNTWYLRQIIRIMRSRDMDGNCSTIITTNLSIAELTEQYSDEFMSLLGKQSTIRMCLGKLKKDHREPMKAYEDQM